VYQREMSCDTLGAFNGFCATMLLVHLLESRAVFKDSSSFQMFRAVLVCIAESGWDSKGLVMAWDKSVTSGPDLAAYTAAFDVVFVGPSGQLNLLAQMTKGQYQLLKREAAIGVEMLGDSVQDGFDGEPCPRAMSSLAPSLAYLSDLLPPSLTSLPDLHDLLLPPSLSRRPSVADLSAHRALPCLALTRRLAPLVPA